MDAPSKTANGSGRDRVHCLRPLPEEHAGTAWTVPPQPMGAELASNGAYRPGLVTGAITEAIVGLLRARTGRGPPRARTAMDASLAIVTLGDCLTRAERSLVREGEAALASQVRTALLEGMRADAVAAVEAITSRPVVAYLTAHQHEPDLSVIAFHFGPRASL